jgi:ribosome maturation factor RimP
MTSVRPIDAHVAEHLAIDLAALGYELVCLQRLGGGPYPTLQVLAERCDGKDMTVNDGAQISHELARILSDAGESAERYTLEVSAPGADRPLVRRKDYERFAGRVACVELHAPADLGSSKSRRFQGSIVRVTDAVRVEVEFKTEAGEVRVPLQSIASAHLVQADVPPTSDAQSKH